MKAWYFSEESRRLRYGDSRKIELGVAHEVEGSPVLCERGLHASVKPLDALSYAPGPILWRVKIGGKVVTGDDKVCGTKRTYISGGVDASETLRHFARLCALDVIHLWDAPRVVVDYLKTGDESLRPAALAAARDATWDATWAATRAATWAATRAATWAATRAAARDATWDAAWAATWAAARDATWDAQNARLESMLNDLLEA